MSKLIERKQEKMLCLVQGKHFHIRNYKKSQIKKGEILIYNEIYAFKNDKNMSMCEEYQ